MYILRHAYETLRCWWYHGDFHYGLQKTLDLIIQAILLLEGLWKKPWISTCKTCAGWWSTNSSTSQTQESKIDISVRLPCPYLSAVPSKDDLQLKSVCSYGNEIYIAPQNRISSTVVGRRPFVFAGSPQNMFINLYIHGVYTWYTRYVYILYIVYVQPPAEDKKGQKWRPPTTMIPRG